MGPWRLLAVAAAALWLGGTGCCTVVTGFFVATRTTEGVEYRDYEGEEYRRFDGAVACAMRRESDGSLTPIVRIEATDGTAWDGVFRDGDLISFAPARGELRSAAPTILVLDERTGLARRLGPSGEILEEGTLASLDRGDATVFVPSPAPLGVLVRVQEPHRPPQEAWGAIPPEPTRSATLPRRRPAWPAWSFYPVIGLAWLVTIPLDIATAPFQLIYFLSTDSWRLGP